MYKFETFIKPLGYAPRGVIDGTSSEFTEHEEIEIWRANQWERNLLNCSTGAWKTKPVWVPVNFTKRKPTKG